MLRTGTSGLEKQQAGSCRIPDNIIRIRTREQPWDRGLKPFGFLAMDAALKRRSSTPIQRSALTPLNARLYCAEAPLFPP